MGKIKQQIIGFNAVILLVAYQALAQTSVKQDGLTGRIKSIKIEEAQVSMKFGNATDGERKPIQEIQYDENGLRTEVTNGRLHSIIDHANRFTYSKQSNGDVVALGFDESGRQIAKVLFSLNPRGYVISETSYKKNGNEWAIDGKKDFKHDSAGRVTEQVIYNSDGSLYNRTLYTHSGNITRESEGSKSLVEKSFGWIGSNRIYTKDAKGNVIQETVTITYKDPKKKDPPTTFKYSYVYDAKGNWIKKTRQEWELDGKAGFFKPTLSTYRTIVYYD
jgi:hypothetical protein